MNRNHVHCSTGLPESTGANGEPDGSPAVISGMRRDAELLIYIDVRRSLEDGAMKWWMSENGVVLTEGMGEEGIVPVKYFKEVVGRPQQRRGGNKVTTGGKEEERDEVAVGTLWKDGMWVADLPEAVRSRPPPNKSGRGRGGGGRGGRGRGRGQGRGHIS